jgi:hypothetical protein
MNGGQKLPSSSWNLEPGTWNLIPPVVIAERID